MSTPAALKTVARTVARTYTGLQVFALSVYESDELKTSWRSANPTALVPKPADIAAVIVTMYVALPSALSSSFDRLAKNLTTVLGDDKILNETLAHVVEVQNRESSDRVKCSSKKGTGVRCSRNAKEGCDGMCKQHFDIAHGRTSPTSTSAASSSSTEEVTTPPYDEKCMGSPTTSSASSSAASSTSSVPALILDGVKWVRASDSGSK